MRGYLSLLFYSINYVAEVARCLDILKMLKKSLCYLKDDQLTVNFAILTSEGSPAWKNGVQIALQQLPGHIKYALRTQNRSWRIRFHDSMFKSEGEVTVVIFADRYDIHAGVLLFDEEDFRPHLTFWQLDGSVAATAVELVDIHDGDIVLDMACDCGELTLEVLRNYDCFCIAMSPNIDQLAMAEVNWVGLQNQLRKEAGNRARHLQFIAVEFNKDFFNFNVVNKILCSLPLRWWKTESAALDVYYDKIFTIISKCRHETHSVLLIPSMKEHKRRLKEASSISKYNFQVLEMRRLVTRTTQLYVCLLETKLPSLTFPERSIVDLLVPQDALLPHSLDLAASKDSMFDRSHSLDLATVSGSFMQSRICLPMLHPSSCLDSSVPLTTASMSSLNLPPLSSDRVVETFDVLMDDSNLDE